MPRETLKPFLVRGGGEFDSTETPTRYQLLLLTCAQQHGAGFLSPSEERIFASSGHSSMFLGDPDLAASLGSAPYSLLSFET